MTCPHSPEPFSEKASPKKLCIDLCAGLGGFSQAFKVPGWEVITIDIEKKFKPTIQADVNNLPLKENLRPDCLLMSPDCRKLSIACHIFPRPGIKAALTLIGSCLETVPYLKPKYWLMENPKGRLRWFIGKPHQSIVYSSFDYNYKAAKPTDLWGNLPLPMAKFTRKTPGNFRKIINRKASERAKIPYGVSQAILEGVNN